MVDGHVRHAGRPPDLPRQADLQPDRRGDLRKRHRHRPASRTWSPRAGFNWDLSAETTQQQIRGGPGLFGGRRPYVWLSNRYTDTGNEFTRISAAFNVTNRIPFMSNPNSSQARSVRPRPRNQAVDEDYDFPSLIRGNLGYDRSFAQALIANVEVLFSK